MDNRPIGVFDSGVGGLTVVNALSKVLPNESIYYVGDTARVPYGNKSKSSILKFSEQITEWLLNQNCKMIIIACNTASSLALSHLESNLSTSIIGVIDPGIKCAQIETKNKQIGVLGTRATINSNIYYNRFKELDKEILVISKACPLFVPLVEEGFISGHIPLSVINYYLNEIKKTDIDTIILGCTHYPLLATAISEVLGSSIKLIDSSLATADRVKRILEDNNLLASRNLSEINCYVTDYTKTFKKIVDRFFKSNINSIKKIDVF
jgi:glutamate racemase